MEAENSIVSSGRRGGENRQGWRAGRCNDKGKTLAPNVAAFYLEECLSKEIWKLCERQAGIWGWVQRSG